MQYDDLREKEPHGSSALPLQYYYVDPAHPRYIMALHWHSEFEIIRVLEGEFRVWLKNDLYRLKEGQKLLVSCGTLHRGEPAEGAVYECIVFDIGMLIKNSIEGLCRYLKPILSGTVSLVPLITKEDAALSGIVQNLFACARSCGPGYELKLYSDFYQLFYTLYRDGRVQSILPEQGTGRHLEKLRKLTSWIEEHYAEPVTLEQMSDVAGFSEKYLCRFFKKYTGQTPMNYCILMRVEAACSCIRHNGMNVTEAAYACGFNDLSYFSKVFKSIKGVSPGAYKKLSSENS